MSARIRIRWRCSSGNCRSFTNVLSEQSGFRGANLCDKEKVELYLEHYEAIHDVTEAFEDRWERFTEEWPQRLEDSLSSRGFGMDGTQ